MIIKFLRTFKKDIEESLETKNIGEKVWNELETPNTKVEIIDKYFPKFKYIEILNHKYEFKYFCASWKHGDTLLHDAGKVFVKPLDNFIDKDYLDDDGLFEVVNPTGYYKDLYFTSTGPVANKEEFLDYFDKKVESDILKKYNLFKQYLKEVIHYDEFAKLPNKAGKFKAKVTSYYAYNSDPYDIADRSDLEFDEEYTEEFNTYEEAVKFIEEITNDIPVGQYVEATINGKEVISDFVEKVKN